LIPRTLAVCHPRTTITGRAQVGQGRPSTPSSTTLRCASACARFLRTVVQPERTIMDGTSPFPPATPPPSLTPSKALRLARLHRDRLAPKLPDAPSPWPAHELNALHNLEQRFLEDERAAVKDDAAAAPDDAAAFVAWFEGLNERGPGQGDRLFPWLATTASLEQMRWFLTQELAGEAGFDDLVALTQVKMPTAAKLEMARNYWDEMGRGKAIAMHGPLLSALAEALSLDVDDGRVVWEAVALSVVMVGLASARRYAFHSAGALGAVELTAPGRATLVTKGLERLGVPGRARRYYAVHATVDVLHARAWNKEVLFTLVQEDPRRARALAEGALMRLRAGARCFERSRETLGVP
jgi:hypothetical protein